MFNSILRFVTGRYAAYQTPIILIYLLIHIPFLRCDVPVHVDLSSGVFWFVLLALSFFPKILGSLGAKRKDRIG